MADKLVCPHCGRDDFKAKFGLTNHENACAKNQDKTKFKDVLTKKGITATEVGVDEPCPTCNKSDFRSKSGRTLHVKSCKGTPTEPKENAYVAHDPIDEPKDGCPHCKSPLAKPRPIILTIFGKPKNYLKCNVCDKKWYIGGTITSDPTTTFCWTVKEGYIKNSMKGCPDFHFPFCMNTHPIGTKCPAGGTTNHMMVSFSHAPTIKFNPVSSVLQEANLQKALKRLGIGNRRSSKSKR